MVHLFHTAPCMPGRDGIPRSIIGQVLCGRELTNTPPLAVRWMLGHWHQLAVLAVVLLAARLAFAAARILVRRRETRSGRWLAIVPPVSATPAATVGLWRLLATVLPAPRRWSLRGRRLVWEVHAGGDRMRCGLWVPPGINPTAITRIVQRAWPGARLADARPPTLHSRRVVVGRWLAPQQPEWLPLVDDLPALHRRPGTVTEADDRVRAVFDGLAAAGRTGGGLLQVVVSRAPRSRLVVARRATTDPRRARRTRPGARLVFAVLDVVRAGLLAVLDLIQSGPTSPRRGSAAASDLYTAALAGEARTKYAAGPHVLLSVRVFATGPTRDAARAAASDITSGYSLLCTHLAPRRLFRPQAAAFVRAAPDRHTVLASVAEVAAICGLPAEPAAHGLPAAASRRRAPGRDTWHTGRPHPSANPGTDTETGGSDAGPTGAVGSRP